LYDFEEFASSEIYLKFFESINDMPTVCGAGLVGGAVDVSTVVAGNCGILTTAAGESSFCFLLLFTIG
jgi:hypothetical protein